MRKWFPVNLELVRGIPINAHPGAFGCARKYNFHEGVDLYGKPGDVVNAIRPGVVVSNERFTGPSVNHPWWLETDALLIRDEEGYYVYGELQSFLKAGDTVTTGQNIGNLIPVLPPEKFRPDIPGHSTTMLHLERWNHPITQEHLAKVKSWGIKVVDPVEKTLFCKDVGIGAMADIQDIVKILKPV